MPKRLKRKKKTIKSNTIRLGFILNQTGQSIR